MKKATLYGCSCGKRFETLLEWSTHYRYTMPKVESHAELSREELKRHIEVTLRKHSDNHRPVR